VRTTRFWLLVAVGLAVVLLVAIGLALTVVVPPRMEPVPLPSASSL
jgi:hypothetical protein